MPKDDTPRLNYTVIKTAVDQWIKNRGDHWLPAFPPAAAAPPFYPLSALPQLAVSELEGELEKALSGAAADIPRSREFLHLFALSGVAQLAHLHCKPWQASKEEDGARDFSHSVCPVCGERQLISALTSPVGKRHVHCPTCGAHWSASRIGCIRCGDKDPNNQLYLKSKEFPGVEVVYCKKCGEYFKEFDKREIDVDDFLWEDIRTLPLNFATEKNINKK